MTGRTTRVSVVIIFLNAEAYLQEAVESVLGQAYDQWELLLVDDGSTDASTRFAQSYAGQHPGRVRYLEHPGHENRGTSASRNLGIRHARGDYVAFLDADDLWLAQKLERQVSVLDSQPEAAMVYGNTLYWFGWTGEHAGRPQDFSPPLGVSPNRLVEPPRLLALYLEGKAAVPCPSAIMVRRQVLERVGGFEEPFRGLYEDQVLYAKISLIEPIYIMGDCLEYYRQHPDSICAVSRRTGEEWLARHRFLAWLEAYLEGQGTTDPATWQALRKAQWLNRSMTGSRPPGRARYITRRAKKWLLRLEDGLLPERASYWLWARNKGQKGIDGL